MFPQAELMVQDSLVSGLLGLHADPSELREMLAGRPPDEQDEVIQYISEREPTPVMLSFPRENPIIPGFYINADPSQEADQPVGSLFAYDSTPKLSIAVEIEGMWFNASVRTMCLGPNPTLTIWMSEIVKLILGRQRDALSEQGLSQQRLNTSGFMPLPESFPTPAFRRDVVLSMLYADTYNKVYPRLREIEVEATVETPGNPPDITVARIRR